MKNDLYLFLLTRQPEEVRKTSTFQRFFDEMKAKEYAFIEETAFQKLGDWRALFDGSTPISDLQSRLLTNYPPGPSDDVLANASAFQQNGNQDTFSAVILATFPYNATLREFPVNFGCSASEGLIYASASEVFLRTPDQQTNLFETNLSLYEHWLDFIRNLYHIWHPLYGFVTTNGARFTSRYDLLINAPHFIEEANLLGPELVARIGHTKIASVKMWKQEDLDDGGILLVPYPYNIPHDFGSTEEIARQLGIG